MILSEIMEMVIDANIVFAAIIKRTKTLELMFEENIRLYAPETILIELEKYQDYLCRKGNMTTEEIKSMIFRLKNVITIIYLGELVSQIPEARNICPDPGDIPYFALALKMNIPIWSNDKELKKQKRVKIFTTDELM